MNILDKRLDARTWIIDEYSIADIAIYPWTITTERQGININDFPNVLKCPNCPKCPNVPNVLPFPNCPNCPICPN